ncbi:MAG: 3-hydroxyacyl-CoA dehydrogenase [Candidatus Angelobacter sp.]|jgi:NAD(P)-dependent dehydrogenase (short-subunit alcohol dehydrogenase family)|nr:3-hydroxyacyl-CoA dehydrogenase [Candidatus Angelobacter sp.]
MEKISQALAGKHAMVTGGARGIGAAVTRALVAHGANVTMLGRSPDPAADLAGGTQLHYAQADVCEPEDIQRAFDSARATFGSIHILVNNAGQGVSAPFVKTDFALWRSMMQINLDGTFHCTQAVLPAMVSAGWGRIVNIASTAGLIGYGYVSAYCAAKHGVVGLTRSLALEVATKGVTVNAVCPGYTETEMLQRTIDGIVAKTGRTPAEARADLSSKNPQKRMIRPEEVANAVTWLCLPGSEAITGQSIAVAGGEVM